MYARDRDALLCDLAETYGIYDFAALPVSTLAALAAGLPPGSRVRRLIDGMKLPPDLFLLATAVDHLRLLVWMQSRDGAKNRNRPKPLLEGVQREPEDKTAAFDSPEAFMAARAKAIGG